MLSEKEKEGCIKLLSKLTGDEIISLKDTITNRLISVENRNEAIKAIIEYSESAVELLRRRKVRRDLLFQYLAECGVVVSVNAEKRELIHKVLQFWGSSVPSNCDLTETDSTTSVAVPQSPPAQTPPPSLQQRLAETFVRWFYQLLNSENPSYAAAAVEDRFGPHHFWENCTLKMVSRTTEMTEETFEGSVLVAQRLQALAREEQLLLNPNVGPDGVRVQSSPHGLLIVMACGTIHQNNNCLGVFEQVFGLVKNPLNENNWKVKVTELHLSSSQVTAVPRLSDSTARELLSVAGSLAVAVRD